jgi:predicted DNA-binding transcriptional regulator YafY
MMAGAQRDGKRGGAVRFHEGSVTIARVGQRSPTETIAGIYQAFLARRTWPQSELAKEVGVTRDTIRRILTELVDKGMPLSREEEHPHVYWSVPKNWYPGSVIFKQEEVPELLRQLRRIPQGQGRQRLLQLLLSRLPHAALDPPSATAVVMTRESSDEEERFLSVIEDSAREKAALRMRYLNASRVDASARDASVHRVLLGPPARFVATCHRDGKLKTFRVDGVLDARLDRSVAYRPSTDAALAAYLAQSVDGFHDEGPVLDLSFFVDDPDARWVQKNLPEGMRAESSVGGVRVTARTSAVRQVARFVVGLGASAKPESPELAREVEALAKGALSRT